MEAKTTTTKDTIVLFAEAWNPGWHVYVDGVEHPLLLTNFTFQGVLISPGTHTIVFQYQQPWYVWLGLSLSLLTLGGALIYLILRRDRSKIGG